MRTPRDTFTADEKAEIEVRKQNARTHGNQAPDDLIQAYAELATLTRSYGVLLWTMYQETKDERLIPLIKDVERMLT